MHEALLTRGDVQGNLFEIQMQIYVPENVVLVHSICHLKAQHNDEGKVLALQDILKYEGLDKVIQWLAYMNEIMDGRQAQDAMRFVDAHRSDSV